MDQKWEEFKDLVNQIDYRDVSDAEKNIALDRNQPIVCLRRLSDNTEEIYAKYNSFYELCVKLNIDFTSEDIMEMWFIVSAPSHIDTGDYRCEFKAKSLRKVE